MLKEFAQALVDLIFEWGYIGIFVLMSVESSFIPFPSEIVLVPAGYLVAEGKMDMFMILLSATTGSVFGAFVNYYLALILGRRILQRYGKYFFIQENALIKMEKFFGQHGAISTFTGRLIPGVRQLISIPAGLSRMNLAIFSFYTALGAGIWAFILIMLGFFIGENKELIELYLKQIIYIILFILGIIIFLYYTYHKHKRNK